ncbi:MAG: TIGR00300 family protein [Actinobacteria bacterium]|nr:TIGR00300 family protein [Actinomycetota bacterium]
MTASETVEVRGHIVDSLILAKILDLIVDAGADYRMIDLDLGTSHVDPSTARISITAADASDLAALLAELHPHGAHPVETGDLVVKPAEAGGVLPDGFYATTNLPTEVRVDGHWIEVDRPEMDCALVVDDDGPAARARAVPMHRVAAGDQVAVGLAGIRVRPLEKPRGASPFEFMTSEVSAEKPKALLVARVAERLRAAKAGGGRLLAVPGPAVVHTGAGPHLAALVREGWVDVVFSGNGFAVHDIESCLLGTSLGISVGEGTAAEGSHANHLRVINQVRRWGSVRRGVEDGALCGGVLYECVRRGVPVVLGGSVRDDGPLPDVLTDVVAAQDAMRRHLDGVAVALVLASTLHAVAVGNLLPASVEVYCVDINQAVVTKLTDRGSQQALGIVTDVGLFLSELSRQLIG